LIPSKLYSGNENADGQSDAIDNARDGKYAKRKKNPYPEQIRKEGSKRGLKRARSESAAALEEGAGNSSGMADVAHQSGSSANAGASSSSSSSRAPTTTKLASSIDELRERLHARIEALRSKRGERENSSSGGAKVGEGKNGDGTQQLQHQKKATPSSSSSSSSQQQQHKKQKGASTHEGEQIIRSSSSNSAQTSQRPKQQTQTVHQQQGMMKKASSSFAQGQSNSSSSSSSSSTMMIGTLPSSSAPSLASPSLDVEFGHLSQALPGALAVSTLSIKPLKASKENRIRDQLKKAVKYKESLASLAQQGEEGVQKKITLEFTHALSRAQGEKVHDDPTLLAKALKRRKKEKSKSHADWSKRKSKEKAEMKDRQVERTKNLNNKKNRALKRGDRPPPSSSSHEGGGKGGGGEGSGGSGSGGGGGAPSRPSPVATASGQNRPGFEGRRGFGK